MKIAGVVLAGGQSKRMGKDKAKLTIQDNNLLTQSVNLLQQSAIQNVYVSGQYEGFDCIADMQKNLGPIAGLHACVAQLKDSYQALFIIPVDMPLLTKQNCLHLLNSFQTDTKNNVLGVFYQAVIFPMILPINEQLIDYLEQAIHSTEKKHRSLYRLLKQLNVQSVAIDKQQIIHFENTNTPEEWQSCLKTHAVIGQPQNK